MNNLIIIGAGGLGKEVSWLIEDINFHEPQWNLLGFVDDAITANEMVNGYKVLGNIQWLSDKSYNVICAIADPKVRKKIIQAIAQTNNTFVSIIHPKNKVHSTIQIGTGTIIFNNVNLTIDTTIGHHVIISLNSVIGHDNHIKDFSTLLPGSILSGSVITEKEVLIGAGAIILQGLHIGACSTIGAGAVVTKDIEEETINIGVPAKSIRPKNS